MNLFLFIIVTLIWGSTWIAINFQIDSVDPIVAVAWRFTLAAVSLGVWCLLTRRSLMLPLKVHRGAFLVGLFLYTLDYSFLYSAQHHLVSALLAVLSSSVIYFTVIMRRLFLKKAIRREVVIGATLGLAGISAIFAPEFSHISLQEGLTYGLLLALCSFMAASIGNIISEQTLVKDTPVLQFNFYAMTYSLIFLYGTGLMCEADFTFPDSRSFFFALVYLAVFGSVFAFGAYMKLLQRIGSDRATYVVLVYPIVALIISTFFEGYEWTLLSGLGVLIVLVGNMVAMGKLNRLLNISDDINSENTDKPVT